MSHKTQHVVCYEWEIEVGFGVYNRDLDAQRRFIVGFIGRLYRDMDAGHDVLSQIVSVHFTRIHKPVETGRGTTVRLRVFVELRDLRAVRCEIDSRLDGWRKRNKPLHVDGQRLNWTKAAAPYVGTGMVVHFRDYLAATSRLAYGLCRRHRDDPQSQAMENAVVWGVVHFFLNEVRGRHVDILEFEPNTFMSSCKGV